MNHTIVAMSYHRPISHLPTHEVLNQPPALEHYNLFAFDTPLRESLTHQDAQWVEERCMALGQALGTPEMYDAGRDANRFKPELHTFDRFGHRIDEVSFHPAWHQLMGKAYEHQLPTLPWLSSKPGAHVGHAALIYLFTQVEAGVLCPMAMTYAAVPTLHKQPEIADEWLPRILTSHYDDRMIPAQDKRGVTFGMAMTEKQGGSDVRTNTTIARPIGAEGSGQEYLLTGHKWFCSAPMSDAFLTLAQTKHGLTCFLVPRFRPDGSRNNFFIQRLKDKLGNHSNASSEIEYVDTWARMVGEEGRGIRTIIEMVHHTRLDAAIVPVGMMRQALSQALHHCAHRSAFGKSLIQQPLMRNVLADLALEIEGCVALAMRVARAFDAAHRGDEQAERLARIGTAVTKYWTNKRCPGHIYECLECHGGAGYVETSIMPRLYREAPLNSIWEGSGNVICLDILRALQHDPRALDAVFEEIIPVASQDSSIRDAFDRLQRLLHDRSALEFHARRVTETLALLWQGALLRQHAPSAVADMFCATRLQPHAAHAYGNLASTSNTGVLLDRAAPLGETADA